MSPRRESVLATARTVKEVGAWACAEMKTRIGVCAAAFVPLGEHVHDPDCQVCVSDTTAPHDIAKMGADSLSIVSRELDVAAMFRRTPFTFDNHRLYPFLEKTVTYNEFWVPHRLERQAVHLMGTEGNPLAWVVAFRSIHKRAYTDQDLLSLRQIGESATRAVRGLLCFPGRAPSAVAALRGLEHGIGWPCFVFNDDGQILWMSDDAVVRLSVESVRLGDTRFLQRWPALLEALVEHARRVARSPARAVEPSPDFVQRHLAEGEELVVRWCAGGDGIAPVVVVSVMNRGPEVHLDPLRTILPSCLTPREADVATLAAQGYSALNIASHLDVAESTVRIHLRHAYTKLGVVNRAQLVLKMMGPPHQ